MQFVVETTPERIHDAAARRALFLVEGKRDMQGESPGHKDRDNRNLRQHAHRDSGTETRRDRHDHRPLQQGLLHVQHKTRLVGARGGVKNREMTTKQGRIERIGGNVSAAASKAI